MTIMIIIILVSTAILILLGLSLNVMAKRGDEEMACLKELDSSLSPDLKEPKIQES